MKTKVWAHRGASAYAPENTLEAFELAVSQGADGVELDIQMTKDGSLAVIHDETIDRVCDGSGCVAEVPMQQAAPGVCGCEDSGAGRGAFPYQTFEADRKYRTEDGDRPL